MDPFTSDRPTPGIDEYEILLSTSSYVVLVILFCSFKACSAFNSILHRGQCHLKFPTWDVYSRLPLVHLVHVLDPRQLGAELLPARLALPVAGLGLPRLQFGKGQNFEVDFENGHHRLD